MSEALSVPQGAIAKALQRLGAAGVFEVDRRHVSHQARRLLVYQLTPLGEALARDLRRTVRPLLGTGPGGAPTAIPDDPGHAAARTPPSGR